VTGINPVPRTAAYGASQARKRGRIVSTLLVLGYDTKPKADEVYNKVIELGEDYIADIQSIAVIAKDKDGKFKVETPGHIVAGGTVWGMFWGLLFGLIFFMPLFGLAIGAGMGAIMGAVEKNGVDKAFQQQVRDLMDQDDAAVFMVLNETTEEKFIAALQPFGGDVLKTSLSVDDEEQLKKVLSEA